MNILKLTESGIVVVTKVGIGVALSDKDYPKMVKVTSVAFKEADANCVSTFAKSQENVLTEVLEAEAANLKIVRAPEVNDKVFEAMLDTSYESSEDEEN